MSKKISKVVEDNPDLMLDVKTMDKQNEQNDKQNDGGHYAQL